MIQEKKIEQILESALGDDLTAYDYSVKNENLEIQKILLKAGAKKSKRGYRPMR